MAAQGSEHNQGTSNEAIKRVNLRKTLFITEAGMIIYFNSLWIHHLGLRLRLNEVSIATALQYYHIFHLNMESSQEYDDHVTKNTIVLKSTFNVL